MNTPAKPDPLVQAMGRNIQALRLDDQERDYLEDRWMDQLRYHEGRSASSRRWYYGLRLTAILGGVAIPALVSWQGASTMAAVARGIGGVFGVVVAGASAVEGLYRFGERWERHRRSAEALKAEFWRFSQLSPPYETFADHRAARPRFVERVEQILREDVELYFVAVQTRGPGEAGEGRGAGPDRPEEGRLAPAGEATPSTTERPSPSPETPT